MYGTLWPEERRSLSHLFDEWFSDSIPVGSFPSERTSSSHVRWKEERKKRNTQKSSVQFDSLLFIHSFLPRTGWKMNSIHRKPFDVESILRMPSQSSFTRDSTLRKPFDVRARTTSTGSKDLFSKINQTGKFFCFNHYAKVNLDSFLSWPTNTLHFGLSRNKRERERQEVSAFKDSVHFLSNCSSGARIRP